jgi:hypothetical protein
MYFVFFSLLPHEFIININLLDHGCYENNCTHFRYFYSSWGSASRLTEHTMVSSHKQLLLTILVFANINHIQYSHVRFITVSVVLVVFVVGASTIPSEVMAACSRRSKACFHKS